ncbi:hypothetical protein BN128_3813 [Cronobacter sakazakii 696]|nr:hypothetical protein BN128_3813 [Cronobacter sakazakii 696]
MTREEDKYNFPETLKHQSLGAYWFPNLLFHFSTGKGAGVMAAAVRWLSAPACLSAMIFLASRTR